MPSLLQDAIAALRRESQGTPMSLVLSRQHGASGGLLGLLIDVFSAGAPRQMQDLRNAIKTAEASSPIFRRDLIAGSDLSSPGQSRNPWISPNLTTSVAITPRGSQFQPADGGRQPGFPVGTLPQGRTLESPPTEYVPPPVDDYPRSPVGRRPGGASTIWGGSQGGSETRSPMAVATVPLAGTGIRQGRPAGYRDYTRGAMMPPEADEVGTELDVFGSEILTPESSNVYSIAYDELRGTLYVCYRAPGEATGYRDWTNQCTGEEYKLAIRPFIRGPLYAYGSRGRPVPKWMWDELRQSASKGSWIWDRLRVCGSMWEHRFVYNLVSPGMEGGLYIPKKSTRNGLRVRTVPTVGKGRRSYVSEADR